MIDSNNNVFGHYHDSLINKCGLRSSYEDLEKNFIQNDRIFLFTLHNNQDNWIQKFEQREKVSTLIYDNSYFYRCGGESLMRFYVLNIGSCCNEMKGISVMFNGTNGTELIGYSCDEDDIPFTVKRLIVIYVK